MKPEIILDDASGRLFYWPDVLVHHSIEKLDQSISWRQDTIRMFGRTLPLPRLTAWHGDPEAVYVYSGIRNDPQPWTPLLLEIREALTGISESRYNSVLANRYADGLQSMSWHADDELALGPEPVIASASFGARRRFLFKHRQDGRRIELELPHGSLLVMSGRLQEQWLHALPRTRKPVGLRINLTFRLVHSSSSEPICN